MAAQPQQRPQPSFHGLGELEAAGERRVVLNRPMLVSGSGGKWHVSEQLTPTSAAAAKTTNFFGSSDQRIEGGRAELKWEGAKEQGDEEEKGCGWANDAEAKDTMAAQPQQRSDQRPEGGRAELKWEGAKEQGDEEEKGCGWVHGARPR
ncbi:unnamed protein product, partial [Heterosigma akashiwo]